VTRRRRPGFTRGVRRYGAAAVAASFGREPCGRGELPRTTPPGDRPPAVPAVFRCRTCQHHDQADGVAPSTPEVVKTVTATGSERRALSGLAPPASTVLRIPLRGTRLRRAVDPGALCQPSGPSGEGQAKGQARNAHGEPPPLITSESLRTSSGFLLERSRTAQSPYINEQIVKAARAKDGQSKPLLRLRAVGHRARP
jgi:hypothetical protein